MVSSLRQFDELGVTFIFISVEFSLEFLQKIVSPFDKSSDIDEIDNGSLSIMIDSSINSLGLADFPFPDACLFLQMVDEFPIVKDLIVRFARR